MAMLRLTSFTRGVSRFTVRTKTFAFVISAAVGLVFWAVLPNQRIHRLDVESMRRYRPPPQSNVSTVGRRMEVNEELWSRMVEGYFVPLLFPSRVDRARSVEEAGQFVFVTAASRTFYVKSLSAIYSVQTLFPEKKIIFYDLEDEDHRTDFIRNQMSAICGVTYRSFNFRLYPEHVRRLRLYAWKPIIIYEVLKEFEGVLWIDSSIRFETNNLSAVISNGAFNGGVTLLSSTGHSNYAVTHPQMYVFLPTSLDGMIHSVQHEANCVLVHRTRFAVSAVVWWWVLCALDPLCIAPTARTTCDNPYRSPAVYSNCHRFDQSALNVLLANQFAFDDIRYFGGGVAGVDAVVTVHRAFEGRGKVIVCPPGVAGPFEADTWTYLAPTRAPKLGTSTRATTVA